jgi:hypothetical protein
LFFHGDDALAHAIEFLLGLQRLDLDIAGRTIVATTTREERSDDQYEDDGRGEKAATAHGSNFIEADEW